LKQKKTELKKGVKSMKILMLTWEYPPRVVGGISRVVYDLSHRLIKDGHEVTVVTYRDGEVPYYEDDKGVKE
jgi:glycosyltransferase involved in cell wall biosynthesis